MKLSDLYVVKWKNIKEDVPVDNWFGIVRVYDKQAEDLWKEGKIIVDDSIFPLARIKFLKDVTPVPFDGWDPKSEENMFHGIVEKHFQTMQPSEFGIGSMFSVPVADGSATYRVTEIRGSQVKVDWFGAQNHDRYTDHILGWESLQDRSRIQDMVESQRKMKELFTAR